MKPAKQRRRKSSTGKLEPIDWREFANDAVLHGNMSTLYHRPANEDPTVYASHEALAEIEKRSGGQRQGAVVLDFVTPKSRTISVPTVGPEIPETDTSVPTVGLEMQAAADPVQRFDIQPAVGLSVHRHFKPLRDVQDALTLAGQVLYKTMYGAPDGGRSKLCTKGYRQLANETHLDKDTVRDLIGEFKDKGIIRELRSYNPNTRLSKTYEVFSYKTILQAWRDAGLGYVTTGRKRPIFCTEDGKLLSIRPTVGLEIPPPSAPLDSSSLIPELERITATPVDAEAAARLVRDCSLVAADCTLAEIAEFAWSKATLCRSGKLDNPLGFLIAQLPRLFQPESLRAHRERKRQEREAAAAAAVREQEQILASEKELEQLERRQQERSRVAERHRSPEGIELQPLLEDEEADAVLREWARRMLRLGHRHRPGYD
jgi:hypothetical protein